MLNMIDLQKDIGQIEHQLVQLCAIFNANREIIKKDFEILTNRIAVLEDQVNELIDGLVDAEVLEEVDDVNSRAN